MAARRGESALAAVAAEITSCAACPRLVAWRERVARDKVARFRGHEYWGRPVPGFGDPAARILIVGLAPGAHGANRTGRLFTGDRSGDFLYAALHRAGLASQPGSVARDDGLELRDVYIVCALRCAPPGNAPRPDELARCSRWLDAEVALLPRVRVVVALGAIAWASWLRHLDPLAVGARPRFAHGASVEPAGGGPLLLGSYHVSQQNTQTGRLTLAMFDEILARARRAVEASREAFPDAHSR